MLPDAPTVAASDVDSLRFSSARSVSSRRESAAKPSETPEPKAVAVLIAGAGAMLLIGGWHRDAVATRGGVGDSRAQDTGQAGRAASRARPAALPAFTSAHTCSRARRRRGRPVRGAENAGTRKPRARSFAPIASGFAIFPKTKNSSAGRQRRGAVAARPPGGEPAAPAAPVDIFTRRK